MRELLAPFGINAISAGDMGLDEPEETGTTFRDNARIKARAAALVSGLPAFADDSGLVVDALDGAPGIYSARWAGPEKNFAHAMEAVEQKLRAQGAATPDRRAAHFVSALCVAWPDGHVGRFRRPRRRHAGLAAARRKRFRLRSDVSSRWLFTHLRRNDQRRETRPASSRPGTVASGARVRKTRGGLP